MRTVSPGQLATPGKNVPTICFQLCYCIFQAKVVDWQQYPGEGRELDTTHTSPLGRPPDRAWSSATLLLTQSRPPCVTLSQRNTLRANLHLSPLWIGLLEVHRDLLHGYLCPKKYLCQIHNLGQRMVIKQYGNHDLFLPFSEGVGLSFQISSD